MQCFLLQEQQEMLRTRVKTQVKENKFFGLYAQQIMFIAVAVKPLLNQLVEVQNFRKTYEKVNSYRKSQS